jgi:hypothetical protein
MNDDVCAVDLQVCTGLPRQKGGGDMDSKNQSIDRERLEKFAPRIHRSEF